MDTAMPTLTVGNGFTTTLPGLGRNQNFPNLSEKRITKAVRAALRQKYGDEHVEVSCAGGSRKRGMGRRVRDPRRAAGVSAAGIATACDRRENGYPVVTRRKETRELLGKGATVNRFGTEGSEVQILSPRPNTPKNA